MLEARLRLIAERFWETARHIQCAFPRDIESAIAWSVPLFIVRVPNLWVHDVETYLRKRQLPVLIGAADRPLHGCVIAIRGKGIIAVDGTDESRELRFTIAHEVGHFLLDYQEPRLRAIEKLGATVVEVLDGQRPPRPEERIDGLLANAPVGVYSHFMHRDDLGLASSTILEIESHADRLALELVAPEEEVWRSVPRGFPDRAYAKRIAGLQRLLVRRFGLSSEVAHKYAASLCRSRFGGASVREWLGVM
jgi:IrrE N-terminal-like domain